MQQKELAQKNLDRERELLVEGSTTDSEAEAAEGGYLRQSDIVLGYQSRLGIIPMLMEETAALLKIKRSQLDEANLRLEKTRCKLQQVRISRVCTS